MSSPDQRHADAGCTIVIGGGGRSVKSKSRQAVEFGLTGALSTDIPDKPRSRLGKTFAMLTAAALFGCAAFGMSQPAKADGAFTVAGINSALPNWSQDTKSEQSSQPRAQIADDATFSALRDFAQSVGPSEPASIKGQTKLAEADNLMDWLSQPKSAEPAAKPAKGPAAKGKTKTAPVEAHFVGDKVCAGCHSAQIAEFKKTLMGRISITQPGKFSCENCHGPGSAHAKAGGGRGVGGIMSFEADDPRTLGRKERDLSRLPRAWPAYALAGQRS